MFYTRMLVFIVSFLAGSIGTAVAAVSTDPSAVQVFDSTWPKVLTSQGSNYTIFQPQVEQWNGYRFQAHAAFAVTRKGSEDPTYGVVVFDAQTNVDKMERVVTFDKINVTSVKLPSAPEKESFLRGDLQSLVSSLVRVIALDRVEADMALLNEQKAIRDIAVKNEAPEIVFATTPSVLVYIDGKPVYEAIKGSQYQRILNTRVLILKDEKGRHYLRIMQGWMQATRPADSWIVIDKTTGNLGEAMDLALKNRPADLLEGGGEEPVAENDKAVANKHSEDKSPNLKDGPVPRIVAVTSPTELIVFDGTPNYVVIPGTQLLFADNTTGHLFRHLLTGSRYILLSGRWYKANTQDGPWQHVSQDNLPGDFASIPDTSPKENVKASVTGTEQAKEALIANSIPEMAEVKRSAAKFKPTIDGKPKLVLIEGTDLHRVENSLDPIIRVNKKAFYALSDGVWFFASSLDGSWLVADTIPVEIYSIPPSSPVYNVTYVKVYDKSPDIVVVGYTPGYYGTVVVNGVVVYGTGYVYTPWIGRYWYGYPVTYGWGSSITYSPWAGWSYTFGIGYGWGYWGSPWWGPYPSPYWGPYYGYGYYGYPSYYGGVAYGPGGSGAVWGPGGWAGTTGNVYHRWGSTSGVVRTSGGYNAWTGNGFRNQVGVAYNSKTGTLAAGQRAAVGNVYTGDYAFGKRGVAGNQDLGIVAAGSKVTAGNAYTGREVTAARGAIHNDNTGNTIRVGGIKGESGTVGHVNGNVFSTKDGEVFRHSPKSGWEEVSRSGDWNKVKNSDRQNNLDRKKKARSVGSSRTGAYNKSRQSAGSFSRGSRGRSQGRGRRR